MCCHRDSRAAISAALDGTTRAIDAGVLNGRPFFNIAGIGVDARVARLFSVRGRGSRGLWPYVMIGLREAWRYTALDYEVELEGPGTPVRALLIAFANGREYGNGMRLCGGAELDDGLLDATIVEDWPVVSRLLHARYWRVAGPSGRPASSPGRFGARSSARRWRWSITSTASPAAPTASSRSGFVRGR